jgi:hypothetical protein
MSRRRIGAHTIVPFSRNLEQDLGLPQVAQAGQSQDCDTALTAKASSSTPLDLTKTETGKVDGDRQVASAALKRRQGAFVAIRHLQHDIKQCLGLLQPID